MASRWYVVHVYSGFEKKVAQAIREQAEQKALAERFDEILVPGEIDYSRSSWSRSSWSDAGELLRSSWSRSSWSCASCGVGDAGQVDPSRSSWSRSSWSTSWSK